MDLPKKKLKVLDRVIEKEEQDKSPKWQIILFNDNYNHFEVVIDALQNAVKCSREVAETIAFKAHNSGKASCFVGDKFSCEQVASVLLAYKLTCEIESF